MRPNASASQVGLKIVANQVINKAVHVLEIADAARGREVHGLFTVRNDPSIDESTFDQDPSSVAKATGHQHPLVVM